MAHVTTPRWLSPVSRRIVVIAIAAAAAMMLLTSILVARASAEVAPVTVRNIDGDACVYSTNQYDSFGVVGVREVVPRGDGLANYTKTIDLPNGASILLTSPPNRSHVRFEITGNASVAGGFIFNRTDQKLGSLYDYRPGSVTEGILEPPPRDQGNDKQVTLCLGLSASVSMTATLNGVSVPVVAGDSNPVVTYPLTWVFTIKNTGEVDIDGIIVDENGEVVVCEEGDLGIVEPGETATCTVVQNAPPGSLGGLEKETTFTVTGNAAGREVFDTIESIEFYVGFDCGANVRSLTGDKVVDDGPDVWFWVGEVSVDELECGTAVEVTASLTSDSQVASIVPADGYPFIGTGIATITWDAIPRDDEPLVRTRQSDAENAVIEQCAVVIPIVPDEDNRGFFELEFRDALYEAAVDFDGNGSVDGDICLIQQFNYQVAVGSPPVVYMQLQEVFYIWNDPILNRPK